MTVKEFEKIVVPVIKTEYEVLILKNGKFDLIGYNTPEYNDKMEIDKRYYNAAIESIENENGKIIAYVKQ